MAAEDFLGGTLFRAFCFPMLSAVSGVLLRCALRNDRYAFFKKEDFAVGPQLMLTAALTLVILLTERARKLTALNASLAAEIKAGSVSTTRMLEMQRELQEAAAPMVTAPWAVIGIVFMLFATIIMVKRAGWVSESQMELRFGIALPLVLGVASLMYVMLVVAP